jgi:hypothetical protein
MIEATNKAHKWPISKTPRLIASSGKTFSKTKISLRAKNMRKTTMKTKRDAVYVSMKVSGGEGNPSSMDQYVRKADKQAHAEKKIIVSDHR